MNTWERSAPLTSLLASVSRLKSLAFEVKCDQARMDALVKAALRYLNAASYSRVHINSLPFPVSMDNGKAGIKAL